MTNRHDSLTDEGLRALLEAVRTGETSSDEALARLRGFPIDDLGFARLDSQRALRTGFPEVILCEGKRPEHVTAIVQRCIRHGTGPVLATRASSEVVEAVRAVVPDVHHDELARMIVHDPDPMPKRKGLIAVLTAGTADIPVAQEAAVTAEVMGNTVQRVFDVGVAGLHRLFAHADVLTKASVVVVVAGMEGALPSVVGGLVRAPTIAVPTSIGYGANFGGLSALLGMLNSCAPGLSVVNIDNGFGAGYAASLINTARDG